MDKYEYRLKLDQMKSLMVEKDYGNAAAIADTINWHRIKNVNALAKAGEIYEKAGRYEESREILLMAYDRSPIGKMIVYRLARVAIKMGNYDEAEDYYQEFVEIAPHDNLKYVIKYKIRKAQGADNKTLISILEELKEEEYTEEWAYELAYLYHKEGMSEKCVEACDELVLWFGSGIYVERALELKMIYQPLSQSQEEKYRRFRQKKEGIVEVRPEDELDSGEIINESVQIPDVKLSPERFNTQNLQAELQKSMQQIMSATEKETVDDGMDNIKKLVEEIPYLQIRREEPAQEHIETDEEIDASLKINFQELLMEDYDGQISLMVPEGGRKIPQITGQMSIDEILAEWERTKRAAETAMQEAEQRMLEARKARALQEVGSMMERLVDAQPRLDSGLTPRDLLEEEYLQNIDMDDDEAAEKVASMNQILQKKIDWAFSENMRLDERLADERRAAMEQIPQEINGSQEAYSDMPLAAYEAEESAPGLYAAEEKLAKRQDMPEETGKTEKLWLEEEPEILEAMGSMEEIQPEEEPEIPETMGSMGQLQPEEEPEIPETMDSMEKLQPEEPGTAESPGEETESIETTDYEEEMDFSEAVMKQLEKTMPTGARKALAESDMTPAGEEKPSAESDMEPAGEEKPSAEADMEPAGERRPPAEADMAESETGAAESEVAPAKNERDPGSESLMPAEADLLYEATRGQTKKMPSVHRERKPEPPEESDFKAIASLDKELREIFTYFMSIKGMEQQICRVMTGAARRLVSGRTAATGNLIIQGGTGSGKTVFATSMVKALQKETGHPDGKIGKIEASVLNHKDVGDLLKKVAGGSLIIEKAGEISRETAVKLALLLESDSSGILVIIEDTHKGIEKALRKSPEFAARFSEKINIPIFTSDELVVFAKAYANEQGYTIDEMGVLALYNSISNIQKYDRPTTLAEVKDIVDGAINRSERGGLKKAFSIIMSRRYDEEDYVILREKDFGI